MNDGLGNWDQEQALADVRHALGRSTTLRPAPLEPFLEEIGKADIEEVITCFATELTAVGGHVYRVQSDELKFVGQIAARIADICHSSGVADVALSGSGLVVEMELAEQLTARGLSVFVAVAAASTSDHDAIVTRLAGCGAGVTAVDYAIAETGTIVISSDESNGLLVSLLPPIHIALVSSRQISAGLNDVLGKLQRERINCANPCRSATLITGPSRTSDVELTLSIGVHGPKELHVILFDESDKLEDL